MSLPAGATTTSGEGGGGCPPADVLEILAAGGSTDDQTWAHTQACERCRAALEELRSHAAFVAEYLEEVRPRATGLTGAGPVGRSAGPAAEELDVSADLVPGYRILAPIHRGGQGVVYRALHEKTKRTVAIKMLLAGHFADARQRQRFEREAELAALLKHANLVTIYDTLNLRGGRYAIVMEYIEGVPLDAWAAPGATEKEKIRATIRLFVEVCSGLQHAHSNAIIHRDLKPSNVLVDKEGRARIVDFGIARSLKPEDAAITHTGEFTGTRQFASPEQIGEAMGRPARSDARSDVYSLGVMLFAVLCGKLPYDVGDSIFSSAKAILETSPERPMAVRPAIGKDLETIILKALQKEPDRRYETALSLGRDLERWLKGEAIEARRDSTWYLVRKAVRRNRVPLGIAAAVVAAATWVAVRESGLRAIADERSRQARNSARANLGLLNDQDIGAVRQVSDQRDAARAEKTAWGHVLNRMFNAADPSANANRKMHALWAMRELYSKQRCLRAVGLGVEPSAGVLPAWTLTPEGTGVAVVKSDGEVVRVDVGTGKIETIGSVRWDAAAQERALSADGRWVAEITGQQVRVRAVGSAGGTGAERVMGGPCGALCGFMIDGRVAAVGSDGRLRVMEPVDGRESLSPAHGARVLWADARGGMITATDANGRVLLWDGRSAAWARVMDVSHLLKEETLEPGAKISVGEDFRAVMSPDGARLAVMNGARVHVVEPASGTRTALVFSRTARPQVTFTHGHDRLLLTGRGSAAAVHSTADGRLVDSLVLHEGMATVAGLTPDDRAVVTLDGSGCVRVWDLKAEPWARRVGTHALGVLGVAFAGNDRVVSCGGDGRARVWRLDEGEWRVRELAVVDGRGETERTLGAVVADAGGRFAFVGGYDGRVQRVSVDGSTGESPSVVEVGSAVHALALDSAGKRLAVATAAGEVVLLEAETLAEQRRWRAHDGRVTWITWSGDGTRLATASVDRAVSVWNAADGARIGEKLEHPRETRGVVFSADGKTLYTACDDGAVRLANTKAIVSERSQHEDVIYAMASAPGAGIQATGGRDGVEISAAQYLSALIHLDLPPESAVFCLAFSPDGRRLAAGTQSGGVFVWDLEQFDSSIAGNLEYQLSQALRAAEAAQRRRAPDADNRVYVDEPTASAARAWAAGVLGRAKSTGRVQDRAGRGGP